ncbi:hypothetical protein OSG_eHP11_00040 [environmental Halophage eHP-11]|nr:hypothetical protein OSG_eHP11_00040 [environmental Halophage eHP-11]
MVGYVEMTARLAEGGDVQPAVDDLTTNHFGDASWLVVHTRRDDAEADEPVYRDDPGYYDDGMTDGLRSGFAVNADQHTVEHDAIEAVVGGTKVSATAGSVTVDPPASGTRADGLTIDDSGTVALNGSGLAVASWETHPGKIPRETVETAAFELPTSEFSQASVRGSPPDYLADETVPFPDPLPSDYVDRSEISDADIQQIYDLIDAHPDQETSDLAKSIVDVIFDTA